MLTIFLDLDGVLADFIGGLGRYLKFRNGWEEPTRKGELIHEIFEVAKTDVDNVLMRYATAEFWESLDLLPWAHTLVSWLTLNGRYSLYFASSAGRPDRGLDSYFSRACAGKGSWVSTHFPELRDRLLIIQDKRVLAGPRTVLIDDRESVVTPFREAGGRAVLFPAPWNAEYCTYYQLRKEPVDLVKYVLKDVIEMMGRLPT